MKRRLFFVTKDIKQCKNIVDHLLISHIELKQIHAFAKKGRNLEDIPEATEFQKSDLRHSFGVGLGVGAVLGIITGIAVHVALDMPYSGLMIITTVLGAMLGAWFSTMFGMMTPNQDLEQFRDEIEKGQIVLIVDVQESHAKELKKLLKKKFPKEAERVVETTLLSFP